MESSNRNRALALAALFQSAAMVKEIAWHGRCDLDQLQTMVGSLFAFEANTIESVYGGVDNLERGLRTLLEQIQSPAHHVDGEISRYVISVLYLERKLMKNPEMIKTLRDGVDVASHQSEAFGITHENIMARLGETYQNTISQLGPRIVVQGDQSHLGNSNNAARIRTLLLAGIRAAVLWRQAGGSRWRLIFSRNAIVAEAKGILDRIVE
ncbi:high frequency lysogenization protein HflD [Ectothiorhodospira variabilis]|uniref:high frequency lysogenization protein HflD n=1 Tax=Ectothiorhodospira variabilis TaxID=505694 RepID=UPI001EFBFDA8|nr:high frequency lysogenization protein HflD [Ectothiorhodospira variabilis]MCG5505097.1 high frequency lysogenization protein HflD [Ectothiorhodospira variabilis]MCG5508254.1 high frequency lysogenization protein HflD [Ectothiorhodospira variabilis]